MTLSTSAAALLEATSDPLGYIERFLVIRHVDTDTLPLPWATARSPHETFPPARIDDRGPT